LYTFKRGLKGFIGAAIGGGDEGGSVACKEEIKGFSLDSL
jgi:hypothetical protein